MFILLIPRARASANPRACQQNIFGPFFVGISYFSLLKRFAFVCWHWHAKVVCTLYTRAHLAKGLLLFCFFFLSFLFRMAFVVRGSCDRTQFGRRGEEIYTFV